ncbi:MAG: hypothetical protein Q8P89_00710 [bacterium]|nr:hypothetical protein [bacterium]
MKKERRENSVSRHAKRFGLEVGVIGIVIIGVMLGIRIIFGATEESAMAIVLTMFCGFFLIATAVIIEGILSKRRHPDETNGI